MLCSGILQTNFLKRILYWDVHPLIFQNVPVDIGIAMGQTSVATGASHRCATVQGRDLKIKVQQPHTLQQCPVA